MERLRTVAGPWTICFEATCLVLALEPRKGIPGVGLVGIEDTFTVMPEGSRSLTGTHPGLPLIEA